MVYLDLFKHSHSAKLLKSEYKVQEHKKTNINPLKCDGYDHRRLIFAQYSE
jgi:hypothetical protein